MSTRHLVPDRDAVFAVKPSLIKTFTEGHATDLSRPAGVDSPWFAVDVDFVLDIA